MHPVEAVPTRYNPFVNGEKTQKTHTSIKLVKTQKYPLGWAFKKNPVYITPKSRKGGSKSHFWESLSESQLLPPFTCGFEILRRVIVTPTV